LPSNTEQFPFGKELSFEEHKPKIITRFSPVGSYPERGSSTLVVFGIDGCLLVVF